MTLVLGRVFCGWICPLGTLNNCVGGLRKKRSEKTHPDWYKAKYYILFMLLASSFFTLQIAGIMDPISLLIRSFALSIYPLLTYGVRGTFDAIYHTAPPGLVALSEPIYDFLKKGILPFRQPHYLQAVFIGAMFFGILIMNLVEKRFWCKFLCPLGALFGLLSRYALLKREVSEECTHAAYATEPVRGARFQKKTTTGKRPNALRVLHVMISVRRMQ
jgi:polyferredoxin